MNIERVVSNDRPDANDLMAKKRKKKKKKKKKKRRKLMEINERFERRQQRHQKATEEASTFPLYLMENDD